MESTAGEAESMTGVELESDGAGSDAGGKRSTPVSVEGLGGRPLCIRAGLGRVFPRCSRAGPSVVKGIVGRSTTELHSH